MLPRSTAKTIRKSPSDSVATPGQSTGLGSGSCDSRSLVSASAIVGSPSTTPSAKIACHPTASTSTPPTSGPAANASPITAPQIPIARARASPSNSCASSASEAGNMTAAPSPCSARAAISSPDEEAIVHSADATVNRHTPITNSFLRPNRSASDPAVSWKTASTSEYPLSTHWRSVKDAPRSSGDRLERDVRSRDIDEEDRGRHADDRQGPALG